VYDTVVTPKQNDEPLFSPSVGPVVGAGTAKAAPSLSAADTLPHVTTLQDEFESAATEKSLGHEGVGSVGDATVTVNEHPALLPESSLAVQLTTVLPTLKLYGEL